MGYSRQKYGPWEIHMRAVNNNIIHTIGVAGHKVAGV